MAYEAAGLAAHERAPAWLAALTAQADLVLASDAPRAVDSARVLAPGRALVVSALLRELALAGPHLGGLRLPLEAWALAVGAHLLVASLRRRHPAPAEALRIGAAATWLTTRAHEHTLTVAVTHAALRRQLAHRLVQLGWEAEPGRRSNRHWSAWFLRRRSADR